MVKLLFLCKPSCSSLILFNVILESIISAQLLTASSPRLILIGSICNGNKTNAREERSRATTHVTAPRAHSQGNLRHTGPSKQARHEPSHSRRLLYSGHSLQASGGQQSHGSRPPTFFSISLVASRVERFGCRTTDSRSFGRKALALFRMISLEV